MKIHPLTVCREKLQNNDFITTNYRKKAEMLEDIIAEEEELRNFAAEIYFEISNKILVRNSKRRKVLDCLKKLNLEYNYTSYVTDFDEINTMLEQFENRCQQLLGKKNDFSDAIENDYLNSRNILRNSIMDDTDIYNSISTVNPRIYEKMKWYLEGELRNNTETRKLELVLARIVSHAFTKTSPMGWLNKVGIIGTMNPIRYELKKNNISLNFVLLFQMYDRIILRDEYIEDVKFKLNKNFYIVDSEINIFGQRDNAQNHKLFKSRDCNVKVKNNPYFAPILNQADKNDWYFKDILELLELDKEQTGVFIRKLVEIGLFRIDSYFSDEGDVLQHFVDKLGEITKEKDDLASCVRGDFVEIQKLVKEINQEYSLDLEKRIIEIEKSACEKCGLDAGFKSREFIYKDNIVVKDKVHNLPESAQYSISKLMQLYTIFDVNTRIQQEVKMELERKMKTDSIPINNPYIFQLVANVNMKYSNFWIDPWKQITSESEIIKKLDELRTSFINELLKSAEKNEVVISEEFIDSLINQIPSELKKKKAAYSIFYEMDCDDVVINKIYPGYMSFYNRFLRYTDIIEKYRDEIKDFYKVEGENIAEIYETFGFNAKASKEIDDYEFCELMYKDYSAKPYNINISELPAIDKESEEYQNYNPPFKGENLRISDSVELTRFKEENFDEKYGIITNIYKDMNSSDISIVGCEFRYKDELNFSYGREKGFKKAEDSAILELIERLAIYDVEGEIKKVSYDENNGLNLVNPEELLYYSQEFRNAGNKFDSSFPYKWLKVEEWGSNKGAYIPLQFFSMDVDDLILLMEKRQSIFQ